jgi:hypothetical protein
MNTQDVPGSEQDLGCVGAIVGGFQVLEEGEKDQRCEGEAGCQPPQRMFQETPTAQTNFKWRQESVWRTNNTLNRAS